MQDANAQQDGNAQAETARLRVRAVSKHYGPATVLDRVDLAVAPGELVTLLGPSGCGKTTLLRVIAGLVMPDQGEVTIAGRDMTRVPPHKRNIGVVFQNYALFPHLNVRDNIAFGLRIQGMAKSAMATTIDRYLGLVHLAHLADRPISALSGGQQQRVALARALAVQPTVVLFDEALSALDRKLREEMQVELRQLLREIGGTAIFVTHDQDEALTMSDRIAVMQGGRIEQYAAPTAIYAEPATLFAMSFIGLSMQLKGRVVAADNELAYIDTLAGPVRAKAKFAVGAKVVVAVRPEHVGIVPLAGGNSVSGRLRIAVFHGAHSMLHVDAPNGAQLLAQLPGGSAIPAAGAAVTLHWPVERSFVYPDPDAGA